MTILDKLIKKKTPVAAAPVPAPTSDPNKRDFTAGLVTTKDIIAPSALEVDFNHIRIDNKYYRTLFVSAYPRFVGINWLSSLINFDSSLNISMFIYPTDGKEVLDDLRRKITEMEAELSTDIQRGRLINPATQAKLEDALNLQANLVKGEERFFQFGLYITITSDSVAELDRINKNLEAALGSLLIISKKATLQMEDGFITTLPICQDRLAISRNMDTTSLATTFPFVSSDLSDDRGIMYGINMHNGSLVIFDRFSMPNYNSVVFAMAGAGKSYLIKLEVLRSLMMGTEIIVIDPENEYRELCENSGGQYIAFGYGEASKINPFDLTLAEEQGENGLNTKVLSLHKLLKVMLGDMDPIEESIMDRAVMDAYKMKGITPDPSTQNKEPPLIEDLYKSLIGMEDEKAKGLAARMEKYIRGSFAGIFNQKTTVNLTSQFVVFGIRNLEEALRPVAMQIILDYVWTIVKKTLKKRILVVDEAWYLMKHEDSAEFLRGIVKRGRKYYLGVTTITQDVDDFLGTNYGKEIVTNSAIQILLKQHSAAIEQIGEVFYLSEGEKQLLLAAGKGEGIFFAVQNHVAIKIIASADEHNLISSNPEDVLKKQKMQQMNQGFKPPIQTPPQTTPPKVPSMSSMPPKPNPVIQNLPPINKPVSNPSPDKTGHLDTSVSAAAGPAINRPFQNPAPMTNPGLPPKPTIPAPAPKIIIPEMKPVEIKVAQPVQQINVTQTEIKPVQNQIPTKPIEPIRQETVILEARPRMAEPKPTESKPIEFKPTEIKMTDIKVEEVKKETNKPIFIKTEETKVPQPPQLARKPQPVFEEPKKPDEIKKPEDSNKMDYDKLFGDGIV